MKPNKIKKPRVYIVQGHTGQYEDYRTWNSKAFLSKKKAKKFMSKCEDFVKWYFTKVSVQDSYDNRDEMELSQEVIDYLEYLLDEGQRMVTQGELYDFDKLIKEKSPDKNFYEDGVVSYSLEKIKLDLDVGNNSGFVILNENEYKSLIGYRED